VSTIAFTQIDPIGLAGGLNLYGYAGGDPVNFSDPFGLCPERPWECPDMQADRARLDGVDPPLIDVTNETAAVVGGVAGLTRGGVAVVAKGLRPGTTVGQILGHPNPTKANRAGRQQPFDRTTGRYKGYSSNPGIAQSPLAEFTVGVGQGLIESESGGAVSAPEPATNAQSVGQTVGKIVGAIRGILQ
jgi:uncharacterized protein RhaS with RHS repeats